MKNKLLYISIATLLMACGAPDKKAELEKLKKQKSELETKIASLEEEVSKSDTTKKEKSTEVVATALVPQVFKTFIEIQGRIDADENVASILP